MDYRRKDRYNQSSSFTSSTSMSRADRRYRSRSPPLRTRDRRDRSDSRHRSRDRASVRPEQLDLDEFGRVIDRRDVLQLARDRPSRSSGRRNESRSRSRDRDYTRRRDSRRRHRYRSSSRSSQSCSPPPRPATIEVVAPDTQAMDLESDPIHFDDLDPEEQMRRMMGIGGFDSTKGKKHADVSEADVRKPREWRQYMHRKKGFSRPLSPK